MKSSLIRSRVFTESLNSVKIKIGKTHHVKYRPKTSLYKCTNNSEITVTNMISRPSVSPFANAVRLAIV